MSEWGQKSIPPNKKPLGFPEKKPTKIPRTKNKKQYPKNTNHKNTQKGLTDSTVFVALRMHHAWQHLFTTNLHIVLNTEKIRTSLKPPQKILATTFLPQ